jgi:phosphatidylserine synthase
MSNKFAKLLYRNIPNTVSVLGVLPLTVLFHEHGFQYLIPLIIFNNIFDDLDGILASKLNLKSDFGARLDNVCDAVSHSIFVMVIGMHFGLFSSMISLVAIAAILIRLVSRLDPLASKTIGSSTNELIRHLLFALLLAGMFGFEPAILIIAIFFVHTASMLLPYPMPHMIRSRTKSPLTIGLVNLSLILAWLLPITLPIIAGAFFLTYLYSWIEPFLTRFIAHRSK